MPGRDQIDNNILKGLPKLYHNHLLDILNLFFQGNLYHNSWNNYLTFFIDKPGGKGVRPISISSAVCKLFEKMISARLKHCLESNKLNYKYQFGFRKGHSCHDNLISVTSLIERAKAEDFELPVVFLYIKAAFDNLIPTKLLNMLYAVNCPSNLFLFIEKWITTRNTIFLRKYNDPMTKTLTKGVPQGGVLSPTLFNFYISNLHSSIPEDITLLQFADDCVLIPNSIHPIHINKTLRSNATHRINDTLLTLSLNLSIDKTHYIKFHNSPNHNNRCHICEDTLPLLGTPKHSSK